MVNTVSSTREDDKNLEIQQNLDRKAKRKGLYELIIPYIGLAFIIIFFIIVTKGDFISVNNLENLINQGFTLTIIAVGAAFVYAHGGMDFSVGATCGCAQMVCGLMLLAGFPFWLALIGCILTAMLGASITAQTALTLGVPVFIGSMCVRIIFKGVLDTVTEKTEIVIDYAKYSVMNSSLLKGVILVIFIAVGYYLFNYTSFGKYNKVIGGNRITAVQAGVSNKKWIFLAYLALGFSVGVAAIFAFFRVARVSNNSGSGIEFNIMMAIILGGFPMFGGERSRLQAAIIGALTVTCLSNGLQLWGVDPLSISGIKGVLFVVIVALSYDRSSGKLVS